MEPKICILHDTFLYKGGGERLIMMMARALKADIASGFFDPGSFNLKEEWFKGKTIEVSSPVFKKGLRHIKLKLAFLFKTEFLHEYDTVVFSGDCLSAVRNVRKDTKKIYYCHTPPRYLFDQREAYMAKISWYLKPLYIVFFAIFKWMYFRDLAKMDIIYTNSTNTKNRLKKFTGKDSEIIYPPADLSLFRPAEERKPYYMSFARLSSIKRVDRIIKAFQEMPDKNLIFTYGENDPEKENILTMCQGHANITPMTASSSETLRNLIASSIATIYIPVDEDFGMSPVESMACGVPVIAVADGWLKESIIDGKTGILIDKEARLEDLKKAIIELDMETSISMKEDCLNRAKDFSLEAFSAMVTKKMGS